MHARAVSAFATTISLRGGALEISFRAPSPQFLIGRALPLFLDKVSIL
jgi:hypothetical protein